MCVTIGLGLMILVAFQNPPPAEDSPNAIARDLLAAHNGERAAADLPPLSLDATLSRIARLHAEEMAERREMTHEGADGSRPRDRVKRAGYHYVHTGENVARGRRSVAEIVKTWMNSEGHRANILGDFTQMGGARAEDEDGEPYWCVVFGTPRVRLDPDVAEKEVVEKLAAVRERADKKALKLDAGLAKVARAFAARTAEQAGKPEDERKPPDLAAMLKKEGVAYRDAAILVGSGESTAEELVAKLLEDENQAGTLRGEYDLVGVGYANDAEDVSFWCVALARR